MKKKILLVSNELDLHRIAKISLEGFGYEVVELATGCGNFFLSIIN